jgi:hypothetical protein
MHLFPYFSYTYSLTFHALIPLLFMPFQAMKKGPLGALGLLKGLKMKDLAPEGTDSTCCNVLTVLCCPYCIILYRYLLTFFLLSYDPSIHPSIHPSNHPSFLPFFTHPLFLFSSIPTYYSPQLLLSRTTLQEKSW